MSSRFQLHRSCWTLSWHPLIWSQIFAYYTLRLQRRSTVEKGERQLLFTFLSNFSSPLTKSKPALYVSLRRNFLDVLASSLHSAQFLGKVLHGLKRPKVWGLVLAHWPQFRTLYWKILCTQRKSPADVPGVRLTENVFLRFTLTLRIKPMWRAVQTFLRLCTTRWQINKFLFNLTRLSDFSYQLNVISPS